MDCHGWQDVFYAKDQAIKILAPEQRDSAPVADRVVLDANERHRRRIVLVGEKGTKVLLDFEKPVTLRDGDGLVLEDGSLVIVIGRAELLIEVSAQKVEIDLLAVKEELAAKLASIVSNT